jgi:hypothetical protein
MSDMLVLTLPASQELLEQPGFDPAVAFADAAARAVRQRHPGCGATFVRLLDRHTDVALLQLNLDLVTTEWSIDPPATRTLNLSTRVPDHLATREGFDMRAYLLAEANAAAERHYGPGSVPRIRSCAVSDDLSPHAPRAATLVISTWSVTLTGGGR